MRIAALPILLAIACDDAPIPPSTTSGSALSPSAPDGRSTLTRVQVTFDRVPVPEDLAYLDYANTRRTPLPGAHWQVLIGGSLVHLGSTDADGGFSFEAPAGTLADIRVLAESREHRIIVVDNTRGNAIYAHSQSVQVTGQDVAIHLGIEHDGTQYVDRTGAPFAVLDTLYRITETLLSLTDLQLEPLTVHWSVRNQPIDGDPQQGEIRTSFYNRSTGIWLLGAEDVDTDELDESVIAHEWAHYFALTQSRCDSLGGPHSAATVLHPAVAFSEGAATALGAIHANLERYQDTRGPQQSQGFTWHLDDNRAGPAVGFFGQRSVASILWDLYDTGPDDDDGVAIPLETLVDLWLEDLPRTPAMVGIHAFGSLLLARAPEQAQGIVALFEHEDIVRPVDPWGTGEDNNGGVPDAVRGALVPPLLREGTARMSDVGPGVPGHQLQEYRLRRFTVPTTGRQRLELRSEVDPWRLRVFQQGVLRCVGHSEGGLTACSWRGDAGDVVLIEVSGNGLDAPADAALVVAEARPGARPEDEADERE